MTFNGWFKNPRAKAGQPQFAEVAMPPVVHAAAIEIDLCTGTRIRLHDESQLQAVLIALREVGVC